MRSLVSKVAGAFWSPSPLIAWVALTSLLVVTGPFGTYERCTLLERVVCFGPIVAICLVWGIAVRVAVQHLLFPDSFWRASLVTIALSCVVLPYPLSRLGPILTNIRPEMLPGSFELVGTIAVFGLATAALRAILAPEQAPPPERAQTAQHAPRLLDRIEPALRGPIIRVSARDHYVDVVTDKGQRSLLMRLSDALAELDGADGLQVHRSHWVATGAVARSEKNGYKRTLVLSDGSRVPLSRNYTDEASRRGLV